MRAMYYLDSFDSLSASAIPLAFLESTIDRRWGVVRYRYSIQHPVCRRSNVHFEEEEA